MAVTITFTFTGVEPIEEPKSSDGILHTPVYNYFHVELEIDDGPTYSGTAVTDRDCFFVPQKQAQFYNLNIHGKSQSRSDYYRDSFLSRRVSYCYTGKIGFNYLNLWKKLKLK